MTDPVLILLADLFCRAGIYSGFMALCCVIVNTITSAFSGKGLKIN